MRNPVTVLVTLVSVEFGLYTLSLCAPEWLVQTEGGLREGLFTFCNVYEGFTSCTTDPAWVGTYSLSWMFLAASCALSLAALLSIRPAISRGRRAMAALLLNICSVAFCISGLIAFLMSMEEQSELLKYLGWTFYICCANLFYGLLVSVALGVVQGDTTQVGPSTAGLEVDLPVIAA